MVCPAALLATLPSADTPACCMLLRCPLVNLRKLPRLLEQAQRAWPADSWEACHSLLSQLALYFLLWVEGANLRHTCVLHLHTSQPRCMSRACHAPGGGL